jgi:hypothetical protein
VRPGGVPSTRGRPWQRPAPTACGRPAVEAGEGIHDGYRRKRRCSGHAGMFLNDPQRREPIHRARSGSPRHFIKDVTNIPSVSIMHQYSLAIGVACSGRRGRHFRGAWRTARRDRCARRPAMRRGGAVEPAERHDDHDDHGGDQLAGAFGARLSGLGWYARSSP